MQRQQRILSSIISLAAGAFLGLGAASQAQAADASGTWSFTRAGRGGGDPVKMTLKLKAEGEKLTGTLSSPGGQGGQARNTEISEGKVKGDDISFSVVVERNGNKMTTKYSGKVSGGSIKGKTESGRNGETQSRDWEAKRDK